MSSTNPPPNLRFGPNWFAPEPFFGVDVKDFRPGQTIRVDDSADGFPDKLSRLPAGHYRAQAILDQNPDFQNHAKGVGNLYQRDERPSISTPQSPRVFPLVLDQVVAAEALARIAHSVQEVRFHSHLLSAFYHRDITDICAVVLAPFLLQSAAAPLSGRVPPFPVSAAIIAAH